ncbi:MAG: universal stress protein [Burkholderiaceae bacterium]
MFKKILVPTDGTELSGRAVSGAIRFAAEQKASIVALNVQPPYRMPPMAEVPTAQFLSEEQYEAGIKEYTASMLGSVVEEAKAAGVACETATAMYDHAYQAVIDIAESKGCDLIFMASHGRRGVAGLLLGSETTKVLTHCKIPVLVYR